MIKLCYAETDVAATENDGNDDDDDMDNNDNNHDNKI